MSDVTKIQNSGHVLRSERGFALLYQGEPVYSIPVVTAEDYGKWYGVYLVSPKGEIQRVEDASREYRDVWEDSHIPNPARLWDWARKLRYAVDPLLMQEAADRTQGDWADNDEFPRFGPNVGRARLYIGFKTPMRILDTEVMGRRAHAGEILSVTLPDRKHVEYEITGDAPLIAVLKERGIPWP